MNHSYRVIWNSVLNTWQAVAEIARGKSKSARSAAAAVAMAISGLAQAHAGSLPTGGNIVAGSGSIASSGSSMTITQSTTKMAVDWQSFSIGAGNTVNFIQPSSTATALNRVIGSDVSVIQGALNANGQVFLINPNGVLFTPTAQVNVGGIVASTLNLSNADFMAGSYKFEGSGSNAIINQGNITAGSNGQGGTIALIAAKISNQGNLSANGGNVLLGAGSKVTLDLGGPVKLVVEQAAIDALIENSGAIRANGGTVLLTAKAAGDLASTVINNTGLIEAQTLATGEQGRIMLLAGMEKDRLQVGGTLDASAPNGGDGGFIETSAAEVKFSNSLNITTAAATGKTGIWLLDPDVLQIISTTGTVTSGDFSSGNYPSTSGTGTSTLQTSVLNTVLTSTNVNLQANKWIDFQTSFTYTGARDATLGLYAPTIKLGGDIASNTNKLNLNFGGSYSSTTYAGNLFVYGGARTINTRGGAITFNGNIGGAQNLSISTGTGSVSHNAAVTGTFNVLSTTTGDLAITYTPGTNGAAVVVDFTAGTITADGASRSFSGAFPTGAVTFPAGTVIDLNAKNATTATLTLAAGGTQALTVASGKITVPSGGLIVTKIEYQVGSANAVTIAATNVTYDTSTNAGKVNDLVVQTGAFTLGQIIAVNGNIDIVSSRFVNNAGASAFSPGTSKNWRVWSTNADPFNATTGDSVGGLVYNYKQYNITYGNNTGANAIQGSGNGLLYSYAPTLSVSLTGTISKTYDGSATATLASGNYSISGAVDGDSIVYTKPTSGSYQLSGSADANAGAKDVSVTSITFTSASKGSATVYGYQINSTASGSGSILKKDVSLTAITANDKTYDANTSATISAGTISGTVGGQTLAVSGSGTFADANAGSGKTVTVADVTALTKTDGTGLWSNYNLSTTGAKTTTAAILKKDVTVTANDATRLYDGIAFTGGNGVNYAGLIAGDSLGTVAYGGSSQGAIAAGSYVITPRGLSSGNYRISYVDGTLSIYQQNTVDPQQYLPKTIPVPQFTSSTVALSDTPTASPGGLNYVPVTDGKVDGTTDNSNGARGGTGAGTPRSALGPSSIFVLDGGINPSGYDSVSQ